MFGGYLGNSVSEKNVMAFMSTLQHNDSHFEFMFHFYKKLFQKFTSKLIRIKSSENNSKKKAILKCHKTVYIKGIFLNFQSVENSP